MKGYRILVYVAGSMLALATLLDAQPKFSRDFDLNAKKESKFLVRFRSEFSDLDVENIRRRGAKLRARFSAFKGAAFEADPALLKSLAADPRIAYISPDREVTGAMEYAAPAIGATIAYQYRWTGRNIGVAVVDSGIATSADFNENGVSRVVYAENFVEGEQSTADAYGHGTHVAGIIGGDGSNSDGLDARFTFRGVAPGVRLISLRVLNREGRGTDSQVIAAIQRAIQLKNVYNIRVMNISLGRPIFESCDEDPLCEAVENAWKAGIVVVVSAGNNGRDNSRGTHGYGTISSPGNSPYAITVGAMKDNGTSGRADDQIATFSSKGPTLIDHYIKPDLVAPGNGIISVLNASGTLRARYPGNVIPVSYYKRSGFWGTSNYFRLSGTSMAAPMVSGAAALLLQKEPSLTPDEVKARLMKTATKAFNGGSRHNIFTVGAGYLDIWAALNSNDQIPLGLRALSPRVVFDATMRRVLVVNGKSVIWGLSVIWGNSVVWGNSLFVNGSSVIWGESALSYLDPVASSVIWGHSVVWGDAIPYAEQIAVMGEY